MGQRSRFHPLSPRSPGQSLTEFVIMLPILVLIVWYSFYFFEIFLVRLKLQEAARYVTWEFPSVPLHDYSDRFPRVQSATARFGMAAGLIIGEATGRYEDLDSAGTSWTSPPTGRYRRNTMMAAGWETPLFVTVQGWKPNLTGQTGAEWAMRGLSWVLAAGAGRIVRKSIKNPVARLPVARTVGRLPRLPGHWGFNEQGWVFTRARTVVYNVWMPREIRIGRHRFTVNPEVTLWEKTALLADSWQLRDGKDVMHDTAARRSAYVKQVGRIFLLDRPAAAAARLSMHALRFEAGVAPMSALLPVPQPTPDAATPVVVSLNHRHPAKKKRGVRNLFTKNLGFLHEETGRVRLQTDGGREVFDTAPLTVPGKRGRRVYQDVFDQRGKYFMGCPEPMHTTCGAGLTGNPFGNGVHWPPPGGR